MDKSLQLIYISSKIAKELMNVAYQDENLTGSDADELMKIAKDIVAFKASPAQRLRMKRYYKRKKRKILMQLKKRYHKYKGRLKKKGGLSHKRRKKFTKHRHSLSSHARKNAYKGVNHHKYKFHFFKPNKDKKLFIKSTIKGRHTKIRSKLIRKPIEHVFKLPHKNKLDLSFLKPVTKSTKTGLSFMKRIHKKSKQTKSNRPISH